MKVLVLNCGSSSIKYQLNDAAARVVLARGIVSRIGEKSGRMDFEARGASSSREVVVPDHGRGLELILEALVGPGTGVLTDVSEVSAVGHRVVHGGSFFSSPALITSDVIDKIQECVPLAPLHNPPILVGIREAMRILPEHPPGRGLRHGLPRQHAAPGLHVRPASCVPGRIRRASLRLSRQLLRIREPSGGGLARPASAPR